MLQTNDYLTDEEILKELSNIDSITINDNLENCIKATDEIPHFKRTLIFNKKSRLSHRDIVAGSNNLIEKYDIYKIFDDIPKVLLMNINKIYILSTFKLYKDIAEVTSIPQDVYNKPTYYDWDNDNIVISVDEHIAHVENIRDATKINLNLTFKENVVISIYESLIKELLRSLQSNPIFESEVEQGEDYIEDYCRILFTQKTDVKIDNVVMQQNS